MGGFNVEAARAEGYSDAEIAQHLLDMNDADRGNASDTEVISTLAPISAAPVEEVKTFENNQEGVAPPLGTGAVAAAIPAAIQGTGAIGHKIFGGKKPAAPPPQAPAPVVEVAPGVVEGSGARNWNLAETGVAAPGTQMNKAGMDTNNRLASIVQPGGPMAGGEITPGGIAVSPQDAEALRKAREAAKAKLAAEEARLSNRVKAGATKAVKGIPGAVANAPAFAKIGTAGYNAQDAWNNAQQDNKGRAAIATAGTLGSLASLLNKYPKTRAIGAGVSLAAPAINRAIDYFYPPEAEHKAAGGAIGHYGPGGLIKLASKAPEVVEEYAKPVLKKFSEALGDVGAEGKWLGATQSDRTIVGNGQKGGFGFPGIQHEDPAHAAINAVWGVGKQSPATLLINKNKQLDNNLLLTNYIGSPYQHASNPAVLSDLQDAFINAVRSGKVSPEEIKAMNARLSSDVYGNIFDKSIDITDPQFLKAADTFDKRRIAGKVYSGEGLTKYIPGNGADIKKGQVIPFDDIMNHYTDPAVIGNTESGLLGNRLFNLDNTLSYNPEINKGFPYILGGKDFKVQYEPVSAKRAMVDHVANKQAEKIKNGVSPNLTSYDWLKGLPLQFVDDKYLSYLQKEGMAGGGQVQHFAPGGAVKLFSALGKAIAEHKLDAMPGAQWASWLGSNAPKGAKKEAEAIDFTNWLKNQPKASKADLQSYIDKMSPNVNAVVKGKPGTYSPHYWDENSLYLNNRYTGAVHPSASDPGKYYYSTQGHETPIYADSLTDAYREVERKLGVKEIPEKPPANLNTKYDDWQLPGGRNYKETVIQTKPARQALDIVDHPTIPGYKNLLDADGNLLKTPTGESRTWPSEEAAKEASLYFGEAPTRFQSSHWEEPDVAAHIRTNERPTADNRSALHLEELQSDWGQQGRQRGFHAKPLTQSENDFLDDIVTNPDKYNEADKVRARALSDQYNRTAEAHARQLGLSSYSGIPEGPYVTDTKDWTGLGLKHALHQAADEGHDFLTWSRGDQQAERYNLSKVADRITHKMDPYLNEPRLDVYDINGKNIYNDSVPAEELHKHIGKDAAERLINAPANEEGVKFIQGDDLRIGGEGMKGYYDNILPNTMNDILKQIGSTERAKPVQLRNTAATRNWHGDWTNGQPETGFITDSETGHLLQDNIPKDQMDEAADYWHNTYGHHPGRDTNPLSIGPQMGVEITPELRKLILEQGFPKFSVGGEIVKNLPKIYQGAKDLILPPAENAARTQIIGTLPTYQKAAAHLKDVDGPIIDFGAGLGKGAEEMSNILDKPVHTYEPFAKDWTPTYSNAGDIPSNTYGGLTGLNMLNVIPRDVRDQAVSDIGRVLDRNGLGVLTTRGKDVMKAQGRPGPEPTSIITSRDTYQKGFSPQELEDYLKYILGSKFDVNKVNLGPAGAVIRKKAEGGHIKSSQELINELDPSILKDILQRTRLVGSGGSGDSGFGGQVSYVQPLDENNALQFALSGHVAPEDSAVDEIRANFIHNF